MDAAAIVSGGGRGIGRAITLQLARSVPVVVIGRTQADLESVCDECRRGGGRAVACTGDIADPETAEAALALARSSGWRIGHIVCNAGIGKSGPTEQFDSQEWIRIFAVNVHGAFHLIRAGLPEMLAHGGGAVTILSSIAGVVGVPFDAAYTASKHALVGLARALHGEYRKRGISVAALCPSYIESEMTLRSIRGVMRRRNCTEAEARARIAAHCPGGRILDAGEIAQTVVLLGEGRIKEARVLAARGGYPLIPEED
jgi:NAD(P)-dependent dehydrogenase (short-subunit alcohol dehydrogenase family)